MKPISDFVHFLQNIGFRNTEGVSHLSSKLEWVSSLNSPFMNWFFERIESLPILDLDDQIRTWNGLTARVYKHELDEIDAQILQLNHESQTLESKCHELKLSIYNTTQQNSVLKSQILQKREKVAFKDHRIAETSEKVIM